MSRINRSNRRIAVAVVGKAPNKQKQNTKKLLEKRGNMVNTENAKDNIEYDKGSNKIRKKDGP